MSTTSSVCITSVSTVFDFDGQTYRVEYTVTRDNDGELVVDLSDKIPVETVYQDIVKSAMPVGLMSRLAKLEVRVKGVQ